MFKKMVNVLLLAIFFSSSIAIAQVQAQQPKAEEVKANAAQPAVDQAVKAPVFEKTVEVKREVFSADWWKWLGGIMGSIYVLLWALGEGLTRLSVWTDNKWDNKIAGYLSEAAWLLGSVLGKFGVGVPKLVIQDKAEQIAAKDDQKKSA